MAKRDPRKTALNKAIEEMGETLRALRSHAMGVVGAPSVGSLHGLIGGKNAEFINVRQEIVTSPDQYVGFWLRGFLAALDQRRPPLPDSSYWKLFYAMRGDDQFLDYVLTFLKRTYLKNADALSRTRPTLAQAEMWFGKNNCDYGLFVTPRFGANGWENDKSEIRHFPKCYWTIGHVLHTGLVIPGKDQRITFQDVEQWLSFFENTLVRASGSIHEQEIATRYSVFVRKSSAPEGVPLLIPEFRYNGVFGKHKYRLDFTIVNPFTIQKVGFELSPWSTHGALLGRAGRVRRRSMMKQGPTSRPR